MSDQTALDQEPLTNESDESWDDDEYEREGLRRATIIERYHKLHAQQQWRESGSADGTETDGTDESTGRGGFWAACRELISPTTISKSIIDIETRPTIEADTPADALEAEGIELLRFVCADGTRTRWYSFEPEPPLDHIIDYYADGDLGRLLAAETTVDVQTADAIGSGVEIMLPDPYETHTGHLKYRFQRRTRAVSEQVGDPHGETTVKGTAMLSGIGFWLMTSLSVCAGPVAVLAGSSLGTAVFVTLMLFLVGTLIHVLCGVAYTVMVGGDTHGATDHYRYVGMPLRRVVAFVRRGLARLNRR